MMNMIFEEIYLFDPINKTARMIPFREGINVITSNQLDGTDRGKSVIMRSLYHTLGAEAHFETKWEAKNKVYILKLKIGEERYWIYRSAELYKFFDENKKLLFVATRSAELAEKLKDYIEFAVMLPNRDSQKMEITPPVYNYLPFFIDQDHYEGSNYSSFKNLRQYQNFKDSVLFYHLGIYNEDYFELIRQKERISECISENEKRAEILQAMMSDIDNKIGIKAVSSNIELLRKDVELYRREYEAVFQKLNKSKSKLIELRNQLFDVEALIQEMKKLEKKTESDISKLQNHICPECGSTLENTVVQRSKKYNICEDAIALKNELQISLYSLQREIEAEEYRYQEYLEQLNQYEDKVKINSEQVEDVLKYKGLCDIREGLVNENAKILDSSDEMQRKLKDIRSQEKKYSEKKRDISKKYYELLVSAKIKFGLSEIDDEKFKNISKNFNASGSNRNIATVIWYLAVLKLRREFNSDAISFPLVLDSPNNVETDDVKKRALLEYILNSTTHQLIVSSIGFDVSDFPGKDINLICLENDKYSVLGSSDYEKYSELLNEFCDANME